MGQMTLGMEEMRGVPDDKAVGFFDVETYRGFSPDIAVLGFKERGKPYRAFYDAVEFVKFLKGYKAIRLFGYNSGRYDTPVVLESLRRRGYPIAISNVVFSGSSINLLQMGNVYFKDLILSFGVKFGLNRVAKDFFGETKEDFDASNITEVTPELLKYNEQDVVLTEKIYDELMRIMKVPISTAASMSMKTYKEHFRPDIARLCNRRGIRDTYKGGRTEIFKFKGKDVDAYDVNSMYPFVMKEYPYPVGEVHRERNLNKEGYSFAIVEVPESYIPYLGYKAPNKLLFPCGEFYGYFTNFELREAKRLGAKVQIVEGWVCDRTEHLFEDYIDHFYTERLKAKRDREISKDIMYKTLMNCLYGKFGQKTVKDRIYSMPEEEYKVKILSDRKLRDTDVVLRYASKKGEMLLLREQNDCKHVYHDYIIASYVTAYARHTLHGFFRKAGERSVYYCDTDSIYTTGDLSNWCGDELGMLKKERELQSFEAVMPKLYKGVDKSGGVYIRSKGFRRISPEAFQEIRINGAKLWDVRMYEENYRAVGGFREAMRRFGEFFIALRRKRTMVSEYDKRERVGEHDTKPLVFTPDTQPGGSPFPN